MAQKIENGLEIENVAVSYFSQIFKSQVQLSSIDEFLNTTQLSDEDVWFLSMPYSLRK